MKTPITLAVFAVVAGLQAADLTKPAQQNPLIDYPGFLNDAATVGKLRESRRVSEEEFQRMAAEPGTIVFDARSDSKYEMLHVAGAIHLALTDATADDLARVIPDKSTRILIYCNNNFLNEPSSLQSKVASTSLNIYTFNTLYGYGYRNVYELAPLVDISKSKLTFSGPLAEKLKLKTK
jgi:phage shock protein E